MERFSVPAQSIPSKVGHRRFQRVQRRVARLAWKRRPAYAVPLLVLPLLATPSLASAQTAPGTPALVGTSPVAGSPANPLGVGTTPANPNKDPGKPFAEILRGNGTRAGYLLTQGGVMPETLQVRVGGRVLHANQDYWLDASGGSLYFAQSVGRFETVSVSYRYVESAAQQRSGNALPSLSFNLGQNTRVGFVYNMTPGNGNGLNTSTYGLSLGGKFGQGGLSNFRSLAFFSNNQLSDNVAMPTLDNPDGRAKVDESQLGVDQLILQNFSVKSGGVRVRADYQDVGEKFSGFSSLKMSAAGDAALLKEIGALEGEKGVKRLGFGLGFGPTGKGREGQGLSLDWGQIQDGKGAVTQQSAAFVSDNFRLGYTSRSVDKTFEKFAGLREGDKGQWAKEKGLTSSAFTLGFGFGKSKAGVAQGGLDFSSQNFGDESGGLQRNTLSLNAGALGLTVLSRRADRGFTRLNDLSAQDRTALALDLYRQYDAGAKPEQVTANDLAQVGKEAGLNRDALRLDLGLGKAGKGGVTPGALRVSQIRVSDVTPGKEETPGASAGLRRDSVELSNGGFSFSLISRHTASDFTRATDLADVEKNALALDIRRQFNPAAAVAEVTQKERDQVASEAGVARTAWRAQVATGRAGKDGKGRGALSFGAFSVNSLDKDGTSEGAARRQSLAYQSARLAFAFMEQSIDSTMTRLASLNDFERSQLGKENGLKRREMSMLWQANKVTRIGLTSLRVGSTPEAIAARARKAQAEQKGDTEAAAVADATVQRDSVSVETKNFSFAANFASVGKEFDRANDLALAAPVKQQIEAERGFTRTDYATKFNLFKALSVDSTLYRASNAGDGLGRETFRHAFSLTPTKRTAISFLSTGDLSIADGSRNGTDQALLTLDHNFGKGVTLNLLRDDNNAYTRGNVTGGATTEVMKLQTAQDKPNSLSLENRSVAYETGHYERARNLNLHVKPVKSLSVGYTLNDIERGAPEDKDALAPSESTNALALELKATPNFTVIAGVSERNASDDKDVKMLSVGLSGMPVRNVTLAAKFDEVHHVSQNVKDVADISLSNTKPFSYGPLEGLTVTARYASLNDKRVMQNETMTGRAAFSLWKNKFLLDYGGYTKPDGSTISRLYQFETDANPKRWFHGGILYKSRTLIDGTEHAIRRFTASAQMGRTTKISYLYGTLPEDEKGNILPQETADISLTHSFPKGLNLSIFYRLNDNDATKILARSLGLGLEGRLSSNSKLIFAISADANGTASTHDSTNRLRFGYERAVSADHYFNLTADIRSHSLPGVADEITASLDFRIRF